MIKLDDYQASLILFDNMKQINEKIVNEAVEMWDSEGSGDFEMYITSYLASRWLDMVRFN